MDTPTTTADPLPLTTAAIRDELARLDDAAVHLEAKRKDCLLDDARGSVTALHRRAELSVSLATLKARQQTLTEALPLVEAQEKAALVADCTARSAQALAAFENLNAAFLRTYNAMQARGDTPSPAEWGAFVGVVNRFLSRRRALAAVTGNPTLAVPLDPIRALLRHRRDLLEQWESLAMSVSRTGRYVAAPETDFDREVARLAELKARLAGDGKDAA